MYEVISGTHSVKASDSFIDCARTAIGIARIGKHVTLQGRNYQKEINGCDWLNIRGAHRVKPRRKKLNPWPLHGHDTAASSP